MRSLVIDDEFVALSKMVHLLKPFGQCDAATNGQQALQMFTDALHDACPYHLVTIDINMLDISGITLLGQLQAKDRAQGGRRAKKIIISAVSTSSNVLAAATGECDGFLVKPVRRTALLDKLAELGLLPNDVAYPAKRTSTP